MCDSLRSILISSHPHTIFQGLTEIEVRNMEDVMMVMREGEKNRTVACTKMNTNRWGRFCVDLNIYLVVTIFLRLDAVANYFFNCLV